MNKKQKNTLIRIIVCIALLTVVTVISYFLKPDIYLKAILYLVPYLVIGSDILKKAFKGILRGQVFDENFLMSVATVGAMFLGDFIEGSAVMLFYQIGELFQSIAVGKSRKNISDLMDIRPDYANMIIDGQLKRVDPEEVEVGSEIIVNTGEKIPIDGIVTCGNTSLNTSALTGESLPKNVNVGDQVISGCINMTSQIKVKTTKEFSDSTVAKVLDLVENSSMKKSRSENFITKFARYYTPAVCYTALALAILPPLFLFVLSKPPMWQEWIIRALTFLVISCPCALVISIPLSFFSGIGCASKNGILIKGSNYLEILSNLKYILFDKTGTLTEGVFEVNEIIAENNFNNDDILYYAALAESASLHPIASSIKKAYGKALDLNSVKNIEEIAGYGVKANVNGKNVICGNLKLMQDFKIKVNVPKNSGTVVYIAIDGVYAGLIIISDKIKSGSKAAMQDLKSAGIKKLVMLTGDNKAVAEEVATKIGIDEVKSELLPSDKVHEMEKILNLKNKNEKAAFVGDGINDAPVLSLADIGIAMGGLGSDAAIEAADVVIMDDNPKKIALAMKISLKTLKIVKQNIFFALVTKFICLILGAFGIVNMWLAIFADVGVMIIAVINAIRARVTGAA